MWRQLKREGEDIARFTVARLMRDMGPARGRAGQASENDDQRQLDAAAARQRLTAEAEARYYAKQTVLVAA